MDNIALLFPGQGSQFIGMGKELQKSFSIAKEVFQEVDEALSFNLSDLIFSGEIEDLTKTINAQPAIMAVSVAAYRVFARQLGVKAKLMAGHSLGEYSALCASGVFSLSQTAKLLEIRGRAMQDAVPKGEGAMVALLGATEELVNNVVQESSKFGVCEIANDNGAGQVVLSGEVIAIDNAISLSKDFGIKRAIKLNVSAPFHSSMMKQAALVMKEALTNEKLQTYSMPVISNVTAKPNEDTSKVKDLLVEQVCGKVRWKESMNYMDMAGINTFIEIGPGKVLSTISRKMYPQKGIYNIHEPKDLDLFNNKR